MSSFDQPQSRKHTHAMKWERFPDALPFWVADMDFSAPDAVLNALNKRLEHGALGYTLAWPELLQAVVAWLDEQFNCQIKEEWIVWSSGVVPSFNVACRAFGQQGKVIVHSPNYPPMLQAPALHNCELVKLNSVVEQTENGERWTLDWAQLEQHAADPDCHLFLFCNPANPIGTVFTPAELDRIQAICERHNVIVCSDEIHADLVYDGKHTPWVKNELGKQTGFSLLAASKTFNIPGLGCSYVIIPDKKMRLQYQKAANGIVPWPNLMGYYGTEAAYLQGKPWLNDLLSYLESNRDYLFDQLNQLEGINVIKPQATYLMWFEVTIDTDKKQLFQHFLNHGLAFSNGVDFDGEGYLRWNFACSRELLEQGVERFKQALSLL